ncbi:MAG: oligosaccharide flippase family protein [Crocinitomicaceae bacterium]|nr:oligosaccharide flippase family protein [Crocinitomicaceae bacterium]
MGIVQKDALRTTIISYSGMILGYVNKVYLFLLLLSPEEVGLIQAILSVSLLFAQFANLGTTNTTVKFLPFLRNENNKHSGFLTLNLLIVLAGVCSFTLLGLLFKELFSSYFIERSEAFVDYYYWVIPTGISIVVFKLLDNYLRALYKNVFPVFANEFVLRVFTTIVLVIYGFDYLNFHQLVIAICLMQFIPAIMLVVYLKKIGEWNFSVKSIAIPKRFRKIILSYSLFSYINSLAAVLVVSLDTLMIAGMEGLSAFGVYAIVLYLMRALMIPYGSIARVSSPIIAQHWRDRDMHSMNKLYKSVSCVALFIGLYGFIGVWVSREELFTLLSKKDPEYYSGIVVFLFLMIGRVFDMFMGLNGMILLTSKKYRYDIFFTAILILTVFLLNLWLIPLWGIAGAAIATSIGMILYNIMRLIFVWYQFRITPFKISQLKVIFLFVIVLLFFHFVPIETGSQWINMLVKSVMVTLMFPVIIYLLKLEPEIVNYVDKVLRTINRKLGRREV